MALIVCAEAQKALDLASRVMVRGSDYIVCLLYLYMFCIHCLLVFTFHTHCAKLYPGSYEYGKLRPWYS